MGITQETFDRLITLGLFVFFAVMYIIAFITGKPIDWQGLLAFIVPTANYVAKMFTNSSITTQSIKADVSKVVAQAGNGKETTPVV